MDNVLSLTRGNPLSWVNLILSIIGGDQAFTGVLESKEHGVKFFGQIYQSPKLSSAHLKFLLQIPETDPQMLIYLLEGMIKKAGDWGVKQIVAEVEIDSQFFSYFRQAGFSILAKQQVYRWENSGVDSNSSEQKWRTWTCDDVSAMRSLYLTLIPPLIQPIEPLSRKEMLGLVYYDQNGQLKAYADLVYGPQGIWVLPIIHPQVQGDMSHLLLQMLMGLPDVNGRPVYITTRSYLPWVEQALLNLPVQSTPEQALLVRYLVLRQRLETEFSYLPVENGKTEPTIPLAPIKHHPDEPLV
jgi:hypothetical protein